MNLLFGLFHIFFKYTKKQLAKTSFVYSCSITFPYTVSLDEPDSGGHAKWK
jgi:hypothetical protein